MQEFTRAATVTVSVRSTCSPILTVILCVPGRTSIVGPSGAFARRQANVHGDEDKLVPLSQSEIFHDALKKAGVPVTLYVAKGRGHGISGDDVNRVVREFFDRTLRVKK